MLLLLLVKARGDGSRMLCNFSENKLVSRRLHQDVCVQDQDPLCDLAAVPATDVFYSLQIASLGGNWSMVSVKAVCVSACV